MQKLYLFKNLFQTNVFLQKLYFLISTKNVKVIFGYSRTISKIYFGDLMCLIAILFERLIIYR